MLILVFCLFYLFFKCQNVPIFIYYFKLSLGYFTFLFCPITVWVFCFVVFKKKDLKQERYDIYMLKQS